jgi:hypothetical protein
MPASKDKFQLQCDIPMKIKEFFKSKAQDQNTSVSSILYSNFKLYLEESGNWDLPQSITLYYDTFGEIGYNNLKFYVDKSYSNSIDILSKSRFTDNKGITKHFVYSLYYRLNSNS